MSICIKIVDYTVTGEEWDKARHLQEKMAANLEGTTDRMSKLGRQSLFLNICYMQILNSCSHNYSI